MTVAEREPSTFTDTLHPDSWARFLHSISKYEREPEQRLGRTTLTINRRQPSDLSKARRRTWLSRASAPRLGTADEFCIDVGLHIEAYFQFCERHELPPWEREPEWPA